MKRWWMGLAVAVLLLVPEGQGMDVGKLQPVELLYICKENEKTVVRADTDDFGTGNTLETALQDLHDTTAGVVYLDTVDYVLVTEQTKNLIPKFEEFLRPSVNLVLATGDVDAVTALDYLAIHKPGITLIDHMQGKKELPKLMTVGERYYLEWEKGK